MMSFNYLLALIQCQIKSRLYEVKSIKPPIRIYINILNNRLFFKIKDEYKL